MKKFRELTEAKETVVFGFGRFNPPTTGHEKLIEKVASVAGSNPFFIYPSHTTGPKDPLPHAKKVAWMRKMFPKYKKNIIADRNAKTAIMIAEKLYKDGYKNLIMVAGSDRVKEFDTLLQKYNDAPDKKGNQLFKFDSVKIVSAGERDPDAEGVSGMSASKMRAAAEKGDFDSFKTGIPATLGDADKKKLYFEVRKNMGIREEREMGDDYDSLRDAYLTGKIWNVGEVVEANGVSGEVVRKGTNYLSFVSEDGKVHKAWLHEVKSPLQKLKDFDKSRVAAGKPPIFTDKEPPKFIRMKKSGQMTIMNVPTDEIDKFEKKGYEIIEDLVGVKPMSGPTGQIFALKSEEVELDEDASVYKKTARKNKSGKSTFAFGRRKKLDGQPKEKGGYFVWKLSQNYDGKVKGGIRNSWAQVAKDLSYSDAVKLMNKKLGRKEFKEEVELDERNYAKEYANYQGTPEQIARRSSRNKARRAMGDKAVKGMDVGHADNDPMNNDPKNLRNEDPSDNRREPRLREKEELDEKIEGLVNKAKKSGMPYSILKKVYDRGMAAWKTGHRPGTTPQQWAFARVNSFTTKSAGTWGKADKDLAKQVEQIEEACWVGYKQVGMKKKGDKEVPNCVPEETELNEWGEVTEVDAKSGKELNNPTKGDVKKYKVYVKNAKGNVIKVEFGDPNMSIQRDDPKARANFRARHNCDQKKDKTTAGYWSCKFWSTKSVTDLMKG